VWRDGGAEGEEVMSGIEDVLDQDPRENYPHNQQETLKREGKNHQHLYERLGNVESNIIEETRKLFSNVLPFDLALTPFQQHVMLSNGSPALAARLILTTDPEGITIELAITDGRVIWRTRVVYP
jgi:hypothetical protein